MDNLYVNNFNRAKIPTTSAFIVGLFFLACLFSSDDRFLVINYGFAFRLTLALMLPVTLVGLMSIGGNTLMYAGLGFGLCWVAVNTVVSCVMHYSLRNIGYALWLIYLVGWVVAISGLITNKIDGQRVLKALLWAYFLMALFGIFQFFSGYILGFSPFADFIWLGRLVRVNGLSYEPSFYATYLFPAWCLLVWLVYRKSFVFGRFFTILAFSIITAAMIASLSRMGIGMMLIVTAFIVIHSLILAARGQVAGFLRLLPIIFLIFMGVLGILFITKFDYGVLLQGTGADVEGVTSSYSLDDRLDGSMLLLDVFRSHYIFGVGLGQVPLEVAAMLGVTDSNLEVAKEFDKGAVFLGVMAGTGVIGASLFLLWFSGCIRAAIRAVRFAGKDREVVIGLLIGFIGQFIILQFNQNILRLYVWIFWAVCVAYWRMQIPVAIPEKPRIKSNTK